MLWYVCSGIAIIGLILFLYHIPFKVNIDLKEDETSAGMSVHIKAAWFSFNKNYYYSDPNFSLLESIIIGRFEALLSSDLVSIPPTKAVLNIMQILNNYYNVYKSKPQLKIGQQIIKRSSFISIKWTTVLGCQDAMQTALGAGFLWALKGIAVALASRNCKMERLFLDVKPDFSQSIFVSNFSCILKLRMVHYIVIAIYAIILKVR